MIPALLWLCLALQAPSPAEPEKPVRIERHHDAAVLTLAFSPDGSVLASGSVDRTLRLWDVASGAERLRNEGHPGRVTSLAFTSDGRLLASGCGDGVVRLWDPAAGSLVRSCKGHDGCILTVAFSADGKVLASGGFDETARLWDPATGRELQRFTAHEGAVSGVALTPDGRRLITAGYDSTVRTWDPVSGRQLNQVQRVRRGEVLGVACSPHGHWVLSSAVAGQLARGRDDSTEFDAWSGSLSGVLAVSVDGKTAAAADVEGQVALYETATGREVLRFSLESSPKGLPAFSSERIRAGGFPALALSPACTALAVGDRSGHIGVWRLADLVGAGPNGPLEPADLPPLWDDLASADARAAYRAVVRLASDPEHALPFLAARLAEAPPLDEALVRRNLRALGDEDFAVRERASATLLATLPASEKLLRDALKSEQDLEVHQRLTRLVAALNEPPLSTRRARGLRTLMALEQVGPAARSVLEKIARNPADPLLAEDARAILVRLGRRR